TNRIMEFVRKFNISEGLVSLWSMHTTCALFINEFQTALLSDIKRFLEQMVARDAEYMHNNPDHSDCDRMNADSHLRALLLGHSLTLQVSGGEVVLGQWQRILMAELDGPRARTANARGSTATGPTTTTTSASRRPTSASRVVCSARSRG